MSSTAPIATAPWDNVRQLVGAVINILEKLHGEGFLASGVFLDLGLAKIKTALSHPVADRPLSEVDGFLRKIEGLFASNQLLHPSATDKFQALFHCYLQAAMQGCATAAAHQQQ